MNLQELIFLVRSHCEQNQYDDARQACRRAISISSANNELPVLCEMANLAIGLGCLDVAAHLVASAESKDSQHVEVLLLRGILTEACNEMEHAGELFRRAAELYPCHAQARFFYGRFLATLEQHVEASRELAAADQLRSKTEEVHLETPLFGFGEQAGTPTVMTRSLPGRRKILRTDS